MVRPEFSKIENVTKTGKGKTFLGKGNKNFRPELLKIENESNQKRGKTSFLQSETKFVDHNSPRSRT
jgi:hypothetical protein